MTTVTRALMGTLFAVALSLSATSRAQDSKDPDLIAAVSAFIAQRFHSQPDVYRPTFPIVVAHSVPLRGTITVNGVEVAVYSRAEARDRQLAWFIYFSKVEQTGSKVIIDFHTPFNATGGTGAMERDGGWKLVQNDKRRSSSGARMFYGELYEGVVCRDDTEMARHAQSLGGGFKDAPAQAKCRSKEFSQVADYRQMKKILGK